MRVGQFEIDMPDPPLRDPHCIAMLQPWVNVGNVGSIVLGRLTKLFDGVEIGRLDRPSEFYDFTRYRPQIVAKGKERSVNVPNTVVSACRRDGPPDLLLLHILEPHIRAEDFNDSVLRVLKALGAVRYVLVGGMYDSVPHSRPLPVTGSARNWEVPESLGDIHLGSSTYQGPTSLTSQLTSIASEQVGLETMNLMVHLPLYLKLDDDFSGAARLLSALSSMYGLKDDFPEFKLGEKQYSQVTPAMANNPQLAGLVEKFEREFDERLAKQQPETIAESDVSVGLAPDIEAFLSKLESGSLGDRDYPTAGGV